MADPNDDYPTILGADAMFKGQLRFEKGVRLLGKFEGEITSGGQLLIADGAALTGDVKAGNIRVDGHVKGNLEAGEKVQLTASARVEGDLQAARLEVAEGAVLVGQCAVGVDGQAKVAGTARTTGTPRMPLPPTDTGGDKSRGQTPIPTGGKK